MRRSPVHTVAWPLLATLATLTAGCVVQPLLTVGRHCTADEQCASGLICERSTGRCARAALGDGTPTFDKSITDASPVSDSARRPDVAWLPDAKLPDAAPRPDTRPPRDSAPRPDSTVDSAPPADSTVDSSSGTPCCTRRKCQGSCYLFSISNLTITGLTSNDADNCRVYGDPDAVPARLRLVVFKGGVLTTIAVANGTSSGGQVVSFTSNLAHVAVSAQYSLSGGTNTRTELVCE